jgi:hypothetical protein
VVAVAAAVTCRAEVGYSPWEEDSAEAVVAAMEVAPDRGAAEDSLVEVGPAIVGRNANS